MVTCSAAAPGCWSVNAAGPVPARRPRPCSTSAVSRKLMKRSSRVASLSRGTSGRTCRSSSAAGEPAAGGGAPPPRGLGGRNAVEGEHLRADERLPPGRGDQEQAVGELVEVEREE